MLGEGVTNEECEVFAAYFGIIEIRWKATKSLVILRNYLLQKISRFWIDGIIKDMSLTHNYIFGLVPQAPRVYVIRIDSFFVYFLNLENIPKSPKFERFTNAAMETESMNGKMVNSDAEVPELTHCTMQQPGKIKSNLAKVEDFLICATSRSCFLAKNTVNSEPSFYRIFTDNEADDFQVLQLGSTESIRQLSAGNDHVLILTVSGAVYSMGTGSHGELGHASLESEQQPRLIERLDGLVVVQVACGGWHSAALTDNGDVYLWGWNKYGQLAGCCEVGEILDVPVPLDIEESVVGLTARGNATWLKRVDHSVLTLGGSATASL
uniref:Uncharacterized protein n=1 Tax=Setaria digitata TaxID=48799 RepID=A0A915PMK7_9BILA